MRFDGLIFDLDGTLVDTNGYHTRAWSIALQQKGFDISEEQIARQIGKGGAEFVPALIGEGADEVHGEELRSIHTEIYLDMIEREGVSTLPGVVELFNALRERGIRTAVATAAKEEELKKVIEMSGLDLYTIADEVTTSSDVEKSKPNPDVVEAAAAKMNLPLESVVMVGDTPYDVQAALRAGVHAVAVLTGVWSAQELREAGADAVYENVAAIHRDLARWIGVPA